eukprot:496951-Hanusia_phi.AAC.1
MAWREGSAGQEQEEEEEEERLLLVLEELAVAQGEALEEAAASLHAAIGRGRPIGETMAESVMERTPELLAILVKRGGEAAGEDASTRTPKKEESKERGREDVDGLLCALRIAQALGDLRSFFPNLGETFFGPLFHSLEQLSSLDSLLSEYSKRLPTVVMTLLSLWSPQMSTRKEQ